MAVDAISATQINRSTLLTLLWPRRDRIDASGGARPLAVENIFNSASEYAVQRLVRQNGGSPHEHLRYAGRKNVADIAEPVIGRALARPVD
jgi:hypothetical protein